MIYTITPLDWQWDDQYKCWRAKVGHDYYSVAELVNDPSGYKFAWWFGQHGLLQPCNDVSHGQQLADAAHREWLGQFLTPWEPVLVWEDDGIFGLVARTPFDTYYVRPYKEMPDGMTFTWNFGLGSGRVASSKQEAIDSAQADYAARWEAAKP